MPQQLFPKKSCLIELGWSKNNSHDKGGLNWDPLKNLDASPSENMFKSDDLKYVSKWIWYNKRFDDCACF